MRHPHERSLIQYSLRGILLTLLVVSVLCAIAAPTVRSWDPGRQSRLVMFVCCIVAGAFFGALPTLILRRRVGKHRGLQLLSLSVHDVWDYRWFQRVMPVFCIALAWGNFSFFVLHDPYIPELGRSWMYQMWFLGVMQFFVITYCLLIYLQHRAMPLAEFCENGIIFTGLLFCPWSRYSDYSWERKRTQLVLKLARPYYLGKTLVVPDDQREEVERILAQYIVGRAEDNQ